MEQIRYGMVGGDLKAFIGEVHRKAIAFDTRARLVCGCFSNVPQLNAECAEAYGVDPSRVYADYREMIARELEREDKPDFVSICTPNFLHYEIAKALLTAGINVVCEKPLCFEVSEARELAELAREKGLLFGVTYGYTGYNMVKVMRELVRGGKLGDIVAVSAEYVQDWLLDELSHKGSAENAAIWRTDPKYTGISNSVGDIGTHMENIVHYITGFDIRRLCATVNRYGKALEYNSNMLIEYTNGVNAGYWCSQVAAGKLNGLYVRIYGTEGSLEWEQHYPDYLRYTKRGEAPQTLSRGCAYLGDGAARGTRIPAGHPEGFFEAFANIYRSYISAVAAKKAGRALEGDELDFPTVEDGLEGIRFVHAVIESGDHDSRWVTLN